MTSKEELEKMTVAQIREKLKSRKMPISGTKSELVNRLHESLVAEEKLLEDSGPGGDNIDLSGVNVDEVLGLDDEKDSAVSSASETKPNDSLLSLCSPLNESPELKKTEILSPAKKQLTVNNGIAGAQPTKTGEDGQEKHSEAESATDEDTGAGNKTQSNENERKVQLKMAARLGVPLAESEAKRARATRFGENGGGGENEQKAKRAARFGAPEEMPTKRKSASEEDEKMLKRAERFGLPLKRSSTDTANSNVNSNSTIGEGDELLQKRAKRFSIVYEGGDEETKKAARAKRFGMQ
ncbi:hypothetical protein niasHS_003912 [Heterodera schachtii]|uniref:SAP domain-containing protein n=1 Tax=Heterodera schachtii TaxID=97005 RepID=A0ABD2K4C4_HETSC